MTEPMHTYGCAFKQRGGECDCDAWAYADVDMRPLWTNAQARAFAAEIGRAMSRGFDYSSLAGGFDEGIHDDEEDS